MSTCQAHLTADRLCSCLHPTQTQFVSSLEAELAHLQDDAEVRVPVDGVLTACALTPP